MKTRESKSVGVWMNPNNTLYLGWLQQGPLKGTLP
jgi:hypothetical protein